VSRTDDEHFADALLHLDLAVRHASSVPLDQKAIDATCMRLAAALDALNRVAPMVRQELFGDAWSAMWGMRNRIAHTYALVEADVVLATVRVDVPEICERIETYRSS